MLHAVGSRQRPRIRPSDCGPSRTGGWSARSVRRSGRNTTACCMRSRFRRMAADSRRAASPAPIRSWDRIIFRSSISTRARSVASERFLARSTHRLLYRRRSRGDRPGRKKRRSRLRLAVGRRIVRRPRLCRRCLRRGIRARRLSDFEQLRWTAAPVWTGFPPDRETWQPGGQAAVWTHGRSRRSTVGGRLRRRAKSVDLRRHDFGADCRSGFGRSRER